MLVRICAIGRLGPRSPERVLVNDYLERFAKTGRSIGLGRIDEQEVDDRKGGGMAAEAALLSRAIPAGAAVCCLDERGKALTSPDFAARLGDWRDQGRDIALVIGGADGIDAALRDRADLLLSFGRMVWPHKLVRVMLAEQLYRAATILAGGPYHRT